MEICVSLSSHCIIDEVVIKMLSTDSDLMGHFFFFTCVNLRGEEKNLELHL